jgi:hypothetical protein
MASMAKKKIESEIFNVNNSAQYRKKICGGNGVAKYQWRRTAKAAKAA